MSQTIRGQYEVLQEIGAGGMGKVYQAKDLKLNRTVAIKALLASARGNEERRRRFIIEAQSASALNHPNIITIFDIIEEDGADYMVMEYLPGKTLIETIPRGGMRFPLVIQYGVQIADGLAAAHAAGIVHRDLKPGNIIVSDRGFAKILDFGLAKLTETSPPDDPDATNAAPLTVEGSIMGTVAYMSPEQAQGKKIDARSDIFSLGAVLYEMATGQRAFPGTSPALIMTSVLRDEPKSLMELAPDVPPELEQVISKCLRKDLDERWQTMEEVHHALLALKQGSDSGLLYRPRPTAGNDVTQAMGVAPVTMPMTPAAVVAPVAKSSGLGKVLKVVLASVAALIVLVVAGGLWIANKAAEKLKDTPIVVSEKGVTVGNVDIVKMDAPAKGFIENDDIEEMVKEKVPESLILSQIRNSKTKFDLSSDGLIGLVKAGVSEKIIEAMRDPKKVPAQPTPAVAGSVAPVKTEEKKKPEEKKAVATVAAPASVVVPDGTPVSLTLEQDVLSDAQVGSELFFAVVQDVKVGDAIVVVKGATAKGSIVDKTKKKLLVIGAKTMYQLSEVTASGGGTLKLRTSPRAFDGAPKDKKFAAIKGGSFVGYTDGEQKLAAGR